MLFYGFLQQLKNYCPVDRSFVQPPSELYCALYFLNFSCPERLEKTVDIESSTVEIEERGVKLKLTVVDTPGFGDSLDNSEW